MGPRMCKMHAASRASHSLEKSREIGEAIVVDAPHFYKCAHRERRTLQVCGKSLRELAKPSAHGEPEVIGAFLLQPHMARVIVGEFHNQHALVLGQR